MTRSARALRPMIGAALVGCAAACAGAAGGPGDPTRADAAPDSGWVAIFNGRDLTGWTPKIRGRPLGEDPQRTFRVEEGLLTVSYDGYDDFGARFGHLFYERSLSHYDLRVEYRFVGSQPPGGEAWALKNSGVMLHAQSPESMLVEQDFPISLEAQLLGGTGEGERPTANLCTPGTEVDIDGARATTHCIESASATYHGEEWVTVDLVVRGDRMIAHVVEGDTVMAFTRPEIGGGVVSGYDPAVKLDGTPITRGWIALQSESHPIQFRRVLLREVDPGT